MEKVVRTRFSEFLSEIAITSYLFCEILYFPLLPEVESSYEKALAEEEERITYQRKMLLLSTKKIRERENEMLIQGKNCLLRRHVEANENELESMLRNIEKQVKFQVFSRLIRLSFFLLCVFIFTIGIFAKLDRMCLNRKSIKSETRHYNPFSHPLYIYRNDSDPERKLNCR